MMAPRDIDRVLNAIDDLRDQVSAFKDNIHAQVSDVKTQVAVLVDDRKRASEQREQTYAQVVDTRQRVAAVEIQSGANTDLCARMANDIDAIQQDIADYRVKRELVAPALRRLDVVEQRLNAYDSLQSRALGWWDFIKGIGAIGWTIICGLGAGAIGLLFFWLQRFL